MPPRPPSQRPLSPHIQIYRPQITSVLSILHRITGVGLAIGLLMISWFLLSLMGGPENYATFSAFCGSSLGKFMLVGWAIAASFHVCSGIRHLFFDTGRLFEIEHATLAGYTVLLGTFIFSCVLLITACAGGN